MNLSRLHQILGETTIQLRKGAEVEHRQVGNVAVTEIYAMPSADSLKESPEIEKIDLVLLVVGVDKKKAAEHKDELIAIMKEYPEPDRLKGGPSFIEVGGVIGSQGAAFQLFALGQVLGIWNIITPRTLKLEGDVVRELAGKGLIMIDGFRP